MFIKAMKKALLLSLACAATVTLQAQDAIGGMFINQGIQIASPSNDVVCKIRELTIRETLIVHTPSVNTSNSLFAGQAIPTLQFMNMTGAA
ncbi:MAG: hypothetical protein PVJ92_01920 [Candidatus Dependentiae bacterium]|jgi:hypothetical protein